MHKRSCFCKPFGSERVKERQGHLSVCHHHLRGLYAFMTSVLFSDCKFLNSNKRKVNSWTKGLDYFILRLGDENEIWNEDLRCHFLVKLKEATKRCNLLFKDANKLKEHKQQTGHIKNKCKGKQKQPTKKQLRIDEVLRSTRVDNAANNEIANFVAENETLKNSTSSDTWINVIIMIMMRMTQLNVSFVSSIRFKGPFVTEDKNFL